MISLGHIFYTVVYQIFYYLCGGKAIIQDIVSRKYNKFELPNRSGDVAIITGGGRGIGFHVVKKLLASNMKVVIGCRNVEQVQKKFESEKVSGDSLEVIHLDMKSLESVHSFAKTVAKKYPSVHVLLNNAGVMFVPYEETKDGVECHLAVNYLGHLFLTLLLLPNLIKAGTSDRKARVVNVTSCAHELVINIIITFHSKSYIANAAYAQSKLAQILSTKRLAALFRDNCPNVNIVSVHPGIVDTDLFDGTILKVTAPWILRYICKSPEEGATTVTHACVGGPINDSGTLYYANCREDIPHPMTEDLATQQTLELM
ncbi:hypothetical protein M8J75_003475 [Diaphorina citri]|nr:hypothetical protein M8J75_003475 [Diaphorina citri]